MTEDFREDLRQGQRRKLDRFPTPQISAVRLCSSLSDHIPEPKTQSHAQRGGVRRLSASLFDASNEKEGASCLLDHGKCKRYKSFKRWSCRMQTFCYWPRQVQSSTRVAKESWALLSSDCRANRPHLGLCPEANVPLQGRQGSRVCIPDAPG